MKKQKGMFFLLPNDIFQRDLTNKEFIVYCYLVRCKNVHNQCWPSRSTIAKNCRIKSLTTVDKSIQGLIDKGFIYKTGHYDHNGKGQLSNIYTINILEQEVF